MQVVGGPMVNVRLRANVTVPDLHISSDVVEFGEVKCGECRIISVQLHNYQPVHCDWSAVPSQLAKKHVRTPMFLSVYPFIDLCIR